MEPPPSALAPGPVAEGMQFGAEAGEAGTAHESSDLNSAAEPASNARPNRVEPEGHAWRDEVSARLSRYRARRKIRAPRFASLYLQFDRPEASDAAAESGFAPVSDRALALDGMRHVSPAADAEVPLAQSFFVDAATPDPSSSSGYSGAKILEFPRFAWEPVAPPPDQLAEPVVARPRILEVPEVAPEPPALGGITMEASADAESDRQAGTEIPLNRASLARRILAGAIDGVIIFFASALFGVIFWRVAAVRPALGQMVALGAGIPCVFWAGYQYLLMVYGASTPGLRLAGLELVRFDGSAARRSLRRWRVLASYLSGASLGMGFAWALLDEDALCWHDRITHTYVAPRRPPAGK